MEQFSKEAMVIFHHIEPHMRFEVEARASIRMNGDIWNIPGGGGIGFSFGQNLYPYVLEAFDIMRHNGYNVDIQTYQGINIKYLIYITRDPLHKNFKTNAEIYKDKKEQDDVFAEIYK